MYRIAFSWFSIFALAIAFATAQDVQPPAADAVKALPAKFQAEKKEVIEKGISKHFLPVLVDKADELTQRADKAILEGRWFQAGDLYRQARWQLPYQSSQVPAEHVVRVLGNLRTRHDAAVNAIAFSPDGKLLASAGDDFVVRIWDLANGREVRALTGHGKEVFAVAFSPDGKVLASGAGEPNIRLWNVADGKELRTLSSDDVASVTALVYSPDGKYLIAGQSLKTPRPVPDAPLPPPPLPPNPPPPNLLPPPPGRVVHQICVYDPGTGKPGRTVAELGAPIHSLVFHPSGTALAGAAGDLNFGQVKLWEYPALAEGHQLPIGYWEHFGGAANRLVFSPNGRTLAVAAVDGPLKTPTVKLYNFRESKDMFGAPPRQVITLPPATRLNYPVKDFCAVFSPDGKTLYVGDVDGTIRKFDPETGAARDTLKGHTDRIFAMSFNPSGTQLASAGADHTIRFWESEAVLQSRDFVGHDAAVWKSSFSPDGKQIVSASADRTVRVWDVSAGKVKNTLAGHRSAVTVALFSPDGKIIASAGGDKVVKIWDADSGKHLRDLTGHQATITALDFALEGGGGKKLVSAGSDHKLIVWDYETGKELLTIDEGPTIAAAVAFSPNGKQIAAGNIDQTVRLFEAATGKQQANWSAHGDAIGGLAYSPDGRLLATCGTDQVIRVWSTDTPGTSPIILFGHTGPVSAVAFRKDNLHLASCGSDMSVKLWRLEGGSGKEVQTYRGHRDWITSVAFSKDGFFLASSGADRTIKVWEMTTREIPLLSEHSGPIFAVAVSPDGKYIASGAGDTTIKVWQRETGVEIATLAGHTRPVSALAFSNDGKLLVSGGWDRTLKLWDLATGKGLPLQPAQQQNWSNLNSYPALLAVAPGSNDVFVWEPGFVKQTLNGQVEQVTKIHVFDLTTGVERFSLTDNGRRSHAISIAPDCKSVAIAGNEGSIRIYDLEKRGQMKPGGDWFLFDQQNSAGDICLTPDGSYLAAGSTKGELKICKVDGREVERTIKAHDGAIRCCQISPDGKRVATFGQDNIVKLWDLKTGAELRHWNLFIPGAATLDSSTVVANLAFTPDGKQLVTANANTTLYVLDLP